MLNLYRIECIHVYNTTLLSHIFKCILCTDSNDFNKNAMAVFNIFLLTFLLSV